MKKTIALFLAFIIVSILSAGILYLIGYVMFANEYFSNTANLVTTGLACGVAGLVGPLAGNYINKITSKKKG